MRTGAKAGGKVGCMTRYQVAGSTGMTNPLTVPPQITLLPAPTSFHTPVRVIHHTMPKHCESQDSIDECDGDEEDEFDSAPSHHQQLEMYQDMERQIMQSLEKAKGERTTKLQRRAAILQHLVDRMK